VSAERGLAAGARHAHAVQRSGGGGVSAPRQVTGTGCTVTWAADGRTVAKRYERRRSWFFDHEHHGYDRERRANLVLLRHRPPVRFPRLLDTDRRTNVLHFEAVDGEPYGPKFPSALAHDEATALVDVAFAMRRYRPRVANAVRFDAARRIRRALLEGTLSEPAAAALRGAIRDHPPALRFCHGDITARNVIRGARGPVLIDWEWAGLYPDGWDPAFLWFSLREVPEARALVESRLAPTQASWFWRSALLIQLVHLSLPGIRPGSPFRAAHERQRDELLDRVL
jgi:hypothetical protein